MSTPEYRIVSQIRSSELNEAGTRAVDGWQVTFRDQQTGVTGQVFVADDFYTADNVRTLILAKVATIREVHALTE